MGLEMSCKEVSRRLMTLGTNAPLLRKAAKGQGAGKAVRALG